MALLLPVSLKITPVGTFIMLSGIYYGSMYGGSTTSILVSIPGEPASVMTCVDGYQMALKGRAGPPWNLRHWVLYRRHVQCHRPDVPGNAVGQGGPQVRAPEFFCLVLMGLTLVTYLSRKSAEKALMSALLGLLLSWVGLDLINGQSRFTFGNMELNDGIGVIPLVMGLFGISEVFTELEKDEQIALIKTKIKNLLPTREDWRQSTGPIMRGSVLGFSSASSRVVEGSSPTSCRTSWRSESPDTPKLSGRARSPESPDRRRPTRRGRRRPHPPSVLGIPMNATVALLFAALLIHGVRPGPLMIQERGDIFWGIIASMYIGNIMLLVLNLPLIGLWVKVLKIPYRIIFPMILLFCLIGSYAINLSVLDLELMLGFGALGYLMRKLDFDSAPWYWPSSWGP